MPTGFTGALQSVQEMLNAQADVSINQPTRVALSATFNTLSGTTVLKSAAGIFGGVVLGSLSLTSAIAAWDSSVSGSNLIFKLNAGISAQVFSPLNIKLQNGLTVSAGSILDNVTWIWL